VTGDPGSAGEYPADPPALMSEDAEPGAFGRYWRAFQEWRRARPFWGGLFLLLSGIEFYLSGHLDLLPVKVSFGAQAFLGWLIPIALVLCGLLAWFTPAQRAFYGILGAAISVAALIGLNLGGFFLGMLFGIVGGALAFSWAPDEPAPDEPASEVSAPDAATETIPAVSEEDGYPGAPHDPLADEGGRHAYGFGSGPPDRLASLILLIVMVAAAVLVPPARPAAAAPCPAPARVPASASASPSAHASTAAPGVNPVEGFFQQLGKLLGFGGGGTPSPSPSGSPSPSPSPSAAPSCGTPSGSPSPSGSAPGKVPPPKPKLLAVPAGQPPVNAVPSTQITALLSQSGLSFDGVVDLPTHAGTIRVLQFSLSSSTSTPFELRVPARGGTISLRSSKLTVKGQVKFYTTQIKGNLFGLIPVTFTPDSPPPLVVPDLFFTNATVQLVFVHAATLTAPALQISYL
jgi:uncharacterized protein DUF6114